jgi:hypothetical protein
MSALAPLLEVERTFVGRAENAAFDPEPTEAGQFCCAAQGSFEPHGVVGLATRLEGHI